MNQDSPRFEILPDGKFLLVEDFKYVFPWTSEEDGMVQFVRIPRGFVTNFASVPSILRAFISPIDPDILIAAVVHDYLVNEFETEGVGTPEIYRKIYTDDGDVKIHIDRDVYWNKAIYIMRQIMEHEYNAPKWKQFSVYSAVRTYGRIRNIIKRL